ncbi:hypothetical protein [Streptomyces sp. NPDC048442]|uniref:hypothetical protein n=1 Tax=Streptomyces sp. NPDC048442 TaxID=3154823 RepID=UPI00342664B1
MYRLQAAIATESVLRELVGSTTEACIVPLAQHLWLLPMTDALFDAVTVAGALELDGFWKAPAGSDLLLTTCSEAGPVAYVEADYFGGAGTQTAQVWDAGQVVLGIAPCRRGAVADDRHSELSGAAVARRRKGQSRRRVRRNRPRASPRHR